MRGRFPLTRVIIRVLEIAGAGLTSALVAYLLGRTEPPPPAPPPGVVHLAPADEEMIRSVRSGQAALLDQLRNDADVRIKPQASTLRDQKPERVRVVDTKPDAKVDISTDAKPRLKAEPRTAPRAEEAPQARPLPGIVVGAVARNVGQRDVAAAAAAAPAPDSDTGLSSALRGITARLLPSRERLLVPDQGAVRPPMPVGEFQQSAM